MRPVPKPVFRVSPRAPEPLSRRLITLCLFVVALLGGGVLIWRLTQPGPLKTGAAASGDAGLEDPGLPQGPPDIEIVNRFRPGEFVNPEDLIVRGKVTIVEFYSDRCEPSQQMGRVMEHLARLRPDLAIRQVNIDRRGAEAIDFDSPVAEQYDVHATPFFHIRSPSGALMAEGKDAKEQVSRWYSEATLLEGLKNLPPEIRKAYRTKR